MLAVRTLGFTCLFSGLVFIAMTLWLGINSNVFFDKSHERYYKVSSGNPLNAALDDALLTDKGLRWRALIGKVQVVIWVGFFGLALIESFFAS